MDNPSAEVKYPEFPPAVESEEADHATGKLAPVGEGAAAEQIDKPEEVASPEEK